MTTEQLRYRMDLLSTAFEMLRLKFPHNAILLGLDDDVWKQHLKFILGDRVWGKRVKTAEGKTYAPAWSQVLELEYQIRHRAYKRASQRNISLKSALEEARADDKLLQDHFSSPVSLEAGAAAAREILASVAAASASSQTLSRVERSTVEPPPKKTKVDKTNIVFDPAPAGGKPKKGKGKGKGQRRWQA